MPPTAPSAERDLSAAGTWLELSVEADQEAVETVSEILSRVAPGGVSVEVPTRAEFAARDRFRGVMSQTG